MKRRKVDTDEAPEQTAADFARGVRIPDGPDALSNYIHAHARKMRGPQKSPTKRIVTIRLSPEVVDTYKGTGRGWQSRIDEDLKKAAKRLRAER